MAINVGDLVRITDRLFNYSQWSDMFRQMGFRNDEERDNPYRNGDVLRVFAVRPHPQTECLILYGLEPVGGGTQVLINGHGIEYVFPGNWHIRVTPENNEMLGNWRQAGSIDGLEGIILSEHHGQRGYWIPDHTILPDHCRTEITTEQFRQYVLNQTPTNMPTPNFVLPERWAIAVTEENRNELIIWRSGDLGLPGGYCLSMHQGYWVSDLRHYQDYTLISTEQFRQYVLNQTATDMPTPTTNLENEQEEAVITTTEKVICITDKWNYVNLGEVYEVIKRDEYYTYVKDSVGGESRYAHHYFEEWVDAETKAKRDSFKALFGEHSRSMFKSASDEVQKLMSELYPKLYEYTGWIKLKKDNNHESAWLFEGLDIRLIQDEDTPNEKLRGTIRFDQSDYILDTFLYQGHTFIRFKRNR